MLAYEGRAYAESEYDQTRYRRMCQIVDEFYADLAGLPAAEVGARFAADLGTPTPKVGATAVIPRRGRPDPARPPGRRRPLGPARRLARVERVA